MGGGRGGDRSKVSAIVVQRRLVFRNKPITYFEQNYTIAEVLSTFSDRIAS